MLRGKRKLNKKLLIIVCMALVIIAMSHDKLMSFASAKDDYIIVAKNEATYEDVVDDYEKKIINDESGMLKEQDVAVAHISSWEASKLEKNDDIECIEPIVDVSATGEVNEISSTEINEWNLKMINAVNTNETAVNKKVKIAILDSGIDYNASISVAVRKNFMEEYESMDALFEDTTGHGTSIASILAAKNDTDTRVRGINPNVEIYSAKILDENNVAPMDRVIESIYWAIEQEVDIISISFGTDNYSRALEIAIEDAHKKGILVVAAAGNENSTKIQYPAAFDEVLSVGGVNSQGKISTNSSCSDLINIYAPGEQIKAIGAFDGDVIVSGTSIAVPHVVGIASIIMQRDESTTAEFVKQLLIASANKSSVLNGKGVVDFKCAIDNYDSFEVSKSEEIDNQLQNNNELYIDSGVNYVTGSWGKDAHTSTLTGSNGYGSLNSESIKILKYAVLYSDKSSSIKGMTSNPYFHGYYKKSSTNKDYNYLAGYVYLTRCALAGTYNQSKNGLSNASGQLSEIDSTLQSINFAGTELINNKSEKILQGSANTKNNRSLFILGMAMHAAADIYAHSSYTYSNGKWVYISHNNTEIKEADNINYQPKRYAAAKKVVSTVLDNYLAKKEGSIDDFVLSHYYYDGSYKIRQIYDYAKEIKTLDAKADATLSSLNKPKSGSSNNVPDSGQEDVTDPVVPEAPTVEPTQEVTVPEAPTVEPTQEVTVPEAPTVEPTQEVTVPEQPVVEPTQEVTIPEQPVVEPTQEVTIPEQPVVEPTQEVTIPEQPVVEPTQEVTIPEQPIVEPTQEVTIPKQPTVEPIQEATIPQQPTVKLIQEATILSVIQREKEDTTESATQRENEATTESVTQREEETEQIIDKVNDNRVVDNNEVDNQQNKTNKASARSNMGFIIIISLIAIGGIVYLVNILNKRD